MVPWEKKSATSYTFLACFIILEQSSKVRRRSSIFDCDDESFMSIADRTIGVPLEARLLSDQRECTRSYLEIKLTRSTVCSQSDSQRQSTTVSGSRWTLSLSAPLRYPGA